VRNEMITTIVSNEMIAMIVSDVTAFNNHWHWNGLQRLHATKQSKVTKQLQAMKQLQVMKHCIKHKQQNDRKLSQDSQVLI
jgi:hypothetical protein